MLNDGAAVASLVLGERDEDGAMAYRGRVTLGLRREEFRRVAGLARAACPPFAEKLLDGAAKAVWVEPRLVCRVGFMCRTDAGRLRQPFFIRMAADWKKIIPRQKPHFLPDDQPQ